MSRFGDKNTAEKNMVCVSLASPSPTGRKKEKEKETDRQTKTERDSQKQRKKKPSWPRFGFRKSPVSLSLGREPLAASF